MRINRKRGARAGQYRINVKEVNSVLAYAASFMLTGVTPAVCESVLAEFYCSVKKSITGLL